MDERTKLFLECGAELRMGMQAGDVDIIYSAMVELARCCPLPCSFEFID